MKYLREPALIVGAITSMATKCAPLFMIDKLTWRTNARLVHLLRTSSFNMWMEPTYARKTTFSPALAAKNRYLRESRLSLHGAAALIPSVSTRNTSNITGRNSHQPCLSGAGINLKPQHYDAALALADVSTQTGDPSDLWFEVHTENYFVEGGPRLRYLQAIAAQFPVSFHGVGGSLGSYQSKASTLTKNHLDQVSTLVKRFNPVLVSEHATWSTSQQAYFADLLPLPRTKQALACLCDGIERYQEAIGRSILIENPSNYLDFVAEMDEADFLMEALNRTGAGLLLDVNNLYLSQQNTGVDPIAYLKALAPDKVGEIHIAGFDIDQNYPDQLLIDSHAAPVDQAVWALLKKALQVLGNKPVLLERDDNIPDFSELMNERNTAQAILLNNQVLNDAPLKAVSNG